MEVDGLEYLLDVGRLEVCCSDDERVINCPPLKLVKGDEDLAGDGVMHPILALHSQVVSGHIHQPATGQLAHMHVLS